MLQSRVTHMTLRPLSYAFQNANFLFLITFISQELVVKDITTIFLEISHPPPPILGYSAPTKSADSILSNKTYIFGLNFCSVGPQFFSKQGFLLRVESNRTVESPNVALLPQKTFGAECYLITGHEERTIKYF